MKHHTTLGMQPKQIKKITNLNRAVFITHAQGFNSLCYELIEELLSLAIPLIEYVCESHGAINNGKRLGSLVWVSNFSFYYAHQMSTIEGEMICTDDPLVKQQARMIRSHGMVREMTDEHLKSEISQQ
jgi:CDP-6-deoxy-D-xylo-4-hexulose-3-dehydrase